MNCCRAHRIVPHNLHLCYFSAVKRKNRHRPTNRTEFSNKCVWHACISDNDMRPHAAEVYEATALYLHKSQNSHTCITARSVCCLADVFPVRPAEKCEMLKSMYAACGTIMCRPSCQRVGSKPIVPQCTQLVRQFLINEQYFGRRLKYEYNYLTKCLLLYNIYESQYYVSQLSIGLNECLFSLRFDRFLSITLINNIIYASQT